MTVSRRKFLTAIFSIVSAGILSGCGNRSASAPESAMASASRAAVASSSSSRTVEWPDQTRICHLFFHSLVADPERAFRGSERTAGYLDYMVTIDEFKKILQQVYERNYILVSPHQFYSTQPGGVELKSLRLPEGKKPLVISFDDLSYYEYMDGDGFPDRLIVKDGKIVNEYRDAQGIKRIGAYDHLPIVEDFLEGHPDFSHDGARGVIAMTGYNGVLGYRTSDISYKDQNKNLEQDKKKAKEVADAIKKKGWEFASHSWGHINFTKSSVDHIRADNEKWQAEVAPIVGKTDMLIYPFGADIAGIEDYGNEKFQYLKSQGFNAFFNVDASVPAWGQVGPNYVRQARVNIDGISLKHALQGASRTLNDFFDPHSVLDPQRPESIAGTPR